MSTKPKTSSKRPKRPISAHIATHWPKAPKAMGKLK